MLSMLFYFLSWAVNIYQYVFIVYILLSFFPVDDSNVLVRFIKGLCEPFYALVLRYLPRLQIGMLDLSPIYIFVILNILEFVLMQLYNIFVGMGL